MKIPQSSNRCVTLCFWACMCACVLYCSQSWIYPVNMVEFLFIWIHFLNNFLSTIHAFPLHNRWEKSCLFVDDSMFWWNTKTSLVSLLLCNANSDGRRHRKPINQQQRKLLSCPVVCPARSNGGGESVASLCQLAHDLFNYLALRRWMNPADLWIRPFPIYQKTIKASLYAPSPKHSWAPWPFSRISLLFLKPCGLSNGLQQVGGRTSLDSQVQYVLKRAWSWKTG